MKLSMPAGTITMQYVVITGVATNQGGNVRTYAECDVTHCLTIDVGQCEAFTEADDEKRVGGGVVVDQLQHVHPALKHKHLL